MLAVLAAFVGSDRAHGVTELARALGMNKNMVHRALTMLTERRLSRARRQRPALSDRLSRARCRRRRCRRIRYPRAVAVRCSRNCIGSPARASSSRSSSARAASTSTGSRRAAGASATASARRSVPLHCTEMSRVLLACLSDREIARIPAQRRAARPLRRDLSRHRRHDRRIGLGRHRPHARTGLCHLAQSARIRRAPMSPFRCSTMRNVRTPSSPSAGRSSASARSGSKVWCRR